MTLIADRKQVMSTFEKNNAINQNNLYFGNDFRHSIDTQLEERFYPSASASIAWPNASWSGAYGEESDTLKVYRFGLCSNIITAIAILQLQETGYLNISEDASLYLPFNLKNPYFVNDTITIDHLLKSISSLSNAPDEYYTIITNDTLDVFEWMTNHFLNFNTSWVNSAPGETLQPTFLGYTLLHMIINNVTEKTVEEYSRTNIFQPLKMNNTSFNLSYYDQDQFIARYIQNISGQFDIGMYHVSGSGALLTNAEDLKNLLIMYINEGTFEGTEIITEASYNYIFTKIDDFSFGIGFYKNQKYIGGVENGTLVTHWSFSSGIDSFSSAISIYVFPNGQKFAISLMLNNAYYNSYLCGGSPCWQNIFDSFQTEAYYYYIDPNAKFGQDYNSTTSISTRTPRSEYRTYHSEVNSFSILTVLIALSIYVHRIYERKKII